MKIKATYKLLLTFCFYHTIAYSFPGFEKLVFYKTQETLDKINQIISDKQKGWYLRIGVGELIIINGHNDQEQNTDRRLATELKEAFAFNGPTVLKSLPIHCRELGGWEKGMTLNLNHERPLGTCLTYLEWAKGHWNGSIADVYSPVALHFAATQYPAMCANFLKSLKAANCALLVGNQHIPKNIRTLLLGDKCAFIPVVPTNCYKDIDALEQQVYQVLPKNDDYKVIITCMGPAGKALQKRLWNKLNNVFLFDFGSFIDAICGWDTRAWITDVHFNAQQYVAFLQKELN